MSLRRRALAVTLGLALASCARTRHVARVDGSTRGEDAAGEREVPPDRTRPPVPATPRALLRPGGAAQVKEALAARGLLHDATPGDTLDDATAAALRRFQREKGLAATGFPDRETLRKLDLEPAKIYRSTDSEIGRGGNE